MAGKGFDGKGLGQSGGSRRALPTSKRSATRYDSFEKFMARDDSTDESELSASLDEFRASFSMDSIPSPKDGVAPKKTTIRTSPVAGQPKSSLPGAAGGFLGGGGAPKFGAMKPGSFAASLGFEPVRLSKPEPASEAPKPKPATAPAPTMGSSAGVAASLLGAKTGTKYDLLSPQIEDDDTTPRSLTQKKEDKPVLMREPLKPLPSRSLESSSAPQPRNAASSSLAAAPAPAVEEEEEVDEEYKDETFDEDFDDDESTKSADVAQDGKKRADRPSSVTHNLESALSSLNDQSCATDSETEEQEKERFFAALEKDGKPDYAELKQHVQQTHPRSSSRRSSKSPPAADTSEAAPVSDPAPDPPDRDVETTTLEQQPRGSSSKAAEDGDEASGDRAEKRETLPRQQSVGGPGEVGSEEGTGRVGAGHVDSSIKESWGSESVKDSVTDSPAKRAVSESTMQSTDIAALLAAADQNMRVAGLDKDDGQATKPNKEEPSKPPASSAVGDQKKAEEPSDAIASLLASAEANARMAGVKDEVSQPAERRHVQRGSSEETAATTEPDQTGGARQGTGQESAEVSADIASLLANAEANERKAAGRDGSVSSDIASLLASAEANARKAGVGGGGGGSGGGASDSNDIASLLASAEANERAAGIGPTREKPKLLKANTVATMRTHDAPPSRPKPSGHAAAVGARTSEDSVRGPPKAMPAKQPPRPIPSSSPSKPPRRPATAPARDDATRGPHDAGRGSSPQRNSARGGGAGRSGGGGVSRLKLPTPVSSLLQDEIPPPLEFYPRRDGGGGGAGRASGAADSGAGGVERVSVRFGASEQSFVGEGRRSQEARPDEEEAKRGEASARGVGGDSAGRGEGLGGAALRAFDAKVQALQDDMDKKVAALQAEHEERVRKMAEAQDAQVSELKDRNYALSTRVSELESGDVVKQVAKGAKIPSDICEEDRARLEKTLQEQEVLIQAYQKENERLVVEAKVLQTQVRDKDHALSAENQRLASKLQQLQGDFDALSRRSGNQGGALAAKLELSHAQAAMEEERRLSKAQMQELKFEIDRLRKAKREVEGKLAGIDVEKMRTEADATARLELQLREERTQFERERADMMSRLNWYSENQEMVDKHEAQLKAQAAELSSLAEQLHTERSRNDALSSELDLSGAHGEGKQAKLLKKRIAALEEEKRQREAQPDVIKDLIRAAAPSAEESKAIHDLQARNRQLEKEVEAAVEDAELRMRALRQQTESMRTAYDKRIQTLQTTNKQLSDKLAAKNGGKELPLAKREAEKQVADVRAHYGKKVKELEKQLEEAKEAAERARQPKAVRLTDQQRRAVEQTEGKSAAVQALEDRLSNLKHASTTPAVQSEAATAPTRTVEAFAEEKTGADEQAHTVDAPAKQTRNRPAPATHAHAGGGECGGAVQTRGGGRVDDEPAKDWRDERMAELEAHVRAMQGGWERQRGVRAWGEEGVEVRGGLGVGGGGGGGEEGVGALQRQVAALQRRAMESERAREVAELTLQAVEQCTKSVMEQAQGEAMRRLAELTKTLGTFPRDQTALAAALTPLTPSPHPSPLQYAPTVGPRPLAHGAVSQAAPDAQAGIVAGAPPPAQHSSEEVVDLRRKVLELEQIVRSSRQPSAAASSAPQPAAPPLDTEKQAEVKGLEAKLAELEEKHRRREDELQSLLTQTAGSKKRQESEMHDKNKQIRRFRGEVEEMMIAIEAMRNDRSKASTPHKQLLAAASR